MVLEKRTYHILKYYLANPQQLVIEEKKGDYCMLLAQILCSLD